MRGRPETARGEPRRRSDTVTRKEQKLFRKPSSSQGLAQLLIQAQEMERLHLSRELHDQIGQALTSIKLNLQTMRRIRDPALLADPIAESIDIVDRTLQQVRTMSLGLRPSLLDDLGLVPTLRWHLDHQSRCSSLAIRLSGDHPQGRLPGEIETTCFRIVQEALNNVIRHARATTVTVDLSLVNEQIVLSVRDDGVGFDVSDIRTGVFPAGCLGLLGMEERVNLVGGALEIHSAISEGTEVIARIPLPDDGIHEPVPTLTPAPSRRGRGRQGDAPSPPA